MFLNRRLCNTKRFMPPMKVRFVPHRLQGVDVSAVCGSKTGRRTASLYLQEARGLPASSNLVDKAVFCWCNRQVRLPMAERPAAYSDHGCVCEQT